MNINLDLKQFDNIYSSDGSTYHNRYAKFNKDIYFLSKPVTAGLQRNLI